MARESLVISTLVELADNLVDDYDVIDVLTVLSDRCVETVDVDAAGVMLAGIPNNVESSLSCRSTSVVHALPSPRARSAAGGAISLGAGGAAALGATLRGSGGSCGAG